ncbi:MAG: bile acid:sodium symporter family protein [Polyangiaceae bacterium]|nr:bile acid:sodium symporter family protein [Polyangiaceae bacterium]
MSPASLFPICAIALSAVAYFFPAPFAGASGAIRPLLGLVMLSMGLSLSAANFREVLARPQVVIAGTVLQFGLMPLLAWLVGISLGLDPALLIGLVIVGSCPGGTASNVVTFLARGDVALSVSLTCVSTLLSAVATPLLSWLYLGQTVDVPIRTMMLSVTQLVLLPVLLGTWLNTRYAARAARIQQLLPLLAMTGIVVIIAIIIALSKPQLQTMGGLVLLAVVVHNSLGLLAGYGAATALGFNEKERRTLAIEVGMQNSGLGVALAKESFGALSALPGAIFSIWHNLSGGALAAIWAKKSDSSQEQHGPSGEPPPASVP